MAQIEQALTEKSKKSFQAFYKSVQTTNNQTRGERRARLERVDRQYQREMDLSKDHRRAASANAQGDPTRFQNITIPVVMPQVEAAVTHQTSVFLTEQPLFPVVASPEFIDAALQLETALENQSIRGGWARQLIMFFRDGFKHNFAPIEVTWRSEVTYAVTTDTAASIRQGTATEILWSGNDLKRLDPYNTFVDTRVPPSEVHTRGEFAGYTELISRIELKSRISALPGKVIGSITDALESGLGSGMGAMDAGAMNFYIPDINPNVSDANNKTGSMNWLQWAGISDNRNKSINYQDMYEYTTLYCRILPSEFTLKVPGANTPQIYKLVFVNHEHIIFTELQTNAHNMLPILIGQPKEDGLGYQTKSLADDAEPFQQLSTSYMSSIIASRRKAISDKMLYDPSRVTHAHINSANPTAKIPVRPAAYGKPLNEAVYAIPYNEDQAAVSMQQISAILGLANELVGQNRVTQGQFQKGNKTASEFASVMENATARDQLASIMLEHQVFTPMKLMLKLNILQFQGGVSLYNRKERKVIEIDPVALREAVLEFRVADGLVPANVLLNSENFSVALQVIGSTPELISGYNISPLFSYLMKTQGADVSPFEKSPEQVAYEQALGAWQSTAQLLIEQSKGEDAALKALPPQPKPEDFGYVPAENTPTPEESTDEPAARVSQLGL